MTGLTPRQKTYDVQCVHDYVVCLRRPISSPNREVQCEVFKCRHGTAADDVQLSKA